jgi:hypothetical protein
MIKPVKPRLNFDQRIFAVFAPRGTRVEARNCPVCVGVIIRKTIERYACRPSTVRRFPKFGEQDRLELGGARHSFSHVDQRSTMACTNEINSRMIRAQRPDAHNTRPPLEANRLRRAPGSHELFSKSRSESEPALPGHQQPMEERMSNVIELPTSRLASGRRLSLDQTIHRRADRSVTRSVEPRHNMQT